MKTLLIIAAGLALPLAAQADRDLPTREGFWIGFGLGAGSNLTEGFAGSRGGGGAYIRLGGTVNRHLLVGGEAVSWARTQNNTTLTQGNTAAVVYYYPSREGGLFLKSGMGFANSVARQTAGNTTISTTDVGFGATFGGGVDIQIGRNFFVTPNLDFLVQTIEGSSGAIFLLTVGATWH